MVSCNYLHLSLNGSLFKESVQNKGILQLAEFAHFQQFWTFWKNTWFTHETEKDKTRNVLLGMTKLRFSKLGISKTEKLVWENPTLIGKYLKSNYEKTKNWEFLKWEYCHKTYTSNLRERQNWEIEIPRIPISENWIYRNYIW